jgi:FkbM family methyltransferase
VDVGKLAQARRRLASDGFRGVLQAFREQQTVSRTESFLRYWTTQHDYVWIGRFAAAVTEMVIVEGQRFVAPREFVAPVLRCRFILGRYERPERDLLRRHLDPSKPVVELGAGLGVVACLTNRRLHDPTRHVVVEANPALLPVLEMNRRLNAARFTMVHGALAYGGPTAALRFGEDYLATMAEKSGGDVEVPALTLASLLARFPGDGIVLVCDIEGAETDLVATETAVLAQRVAILILEEHPKVVPAAVRAAMFERLRTAGFSHCEQVADSHVFRNDVLMATTLGRNIG